MHFHYSPISLSSFSEIGFQTPWYNVFQSNTPTNISPYEYIHGKVSPATSSAWWKAWWHWWHHASTILLHLNYEEAQSIFLHSYKIAAFTIKSAFLQVPLSESFAIGSGVSEGASSQEKITSYKTAIGREIWKLQSSTKCLGHPPFFRLKTTILSIPLSPLTMLLSLWMYYFVCASTLFWGRGGETRRGNTTFYVLIWIDFEISHFMQVLKIFVEDCRYS